MHHLPKIILAAGAALLAGSASPAAAHHIRYKADLNISGTWTESVRAGADENDADGDGREEVAQRDQEMRFAVTSSMPSVGFHEGRLRATAKSVTHGVSLEILRSTVVEPNGEHGTCSVFEPGSGGAAELARAGDALVFRPAEDVIFQASCKTPLLEWPFHMDAQRLGGPLGQAPLDATFTVTPAEIGAARIEKPVAASDYQRSRDRCPEEDAADTVACSFEWSGKVVLQRLADAVTIGKPKLKGRTVSVPVSCVEACAPRVNRKRFAVAPGGTKSLALKLGGRARKAKVTVTVDDLERTFTLRLPKAR